MQSYAHFRQVSRQEMDRMAEACQEAEVLSAASLIQQAGKRWNRLHVTGIGKPGRLAGYLASLLSSTGIPAYFLHGAEAVHGSCGQLVPGDVVICISNSGETEELKATAQAIQRNGCEIIAVMSNPNSWLAKSSQAHLTDGTQEEGGPLNRAPRMSIIAEAYVLQALSVILQEMQGLTVQGYILRHPGGSLGKLRKNETE